MAGTTNDVARLPPGQQTLGHFPRFGRRPWRRAPRQEAPTVVFGGALDRRVEITVTDLMELPRREIVADFHCVTGWSVTGLRWAGVPFAVVHDRIIRPRLESGRPITHVDVWGSDGEHYVARLDDLLGEDVLLADRLDGAPLPGRHGAPLRLVSPAQYGYVNIKHVCRIDVHTGEPTGGGTSLAHRLLASHPRARVWAAERHPWLPAWLVLPVYRVLRGLILRGAGRSRR